MSCAPELITERPDSIGPAQGVVVDNNVSHMASYVYVLCQVYADLSYPL